MTEDGRSIPAAPPGQGASRASGERSIALDLLRALAVFLVIGMHLRNCPPQESAVLHAITKVLTTGGWVGVDLFFVLSGFLISGLLFREHRRFGRIAFGRFFLRRGLKIYPAFWALIFVTVALRWIHSTPPEWARIAREIFFFQNYLPGFWTHTWSLAVEEHFYLALPLLLVAMTRVRPGDERPFRGLWIGCAALAVACLVLRCLGAGEPFTHHTHHFPTHLRVDSLFFGVSLSYFFHYHPEGWQRVTSRNRWGFIALGVLLFLPAFMYRHSSTPFIYTVGFSLFAIASGLLLAGVLALKLPTHPLVRAMAFTGSHSYSIYLWHTFVAHDAVNFVQRIFPMKWTWFWYAAVYLSGAIGVGIVLSVLIEYPILHVRDRWFPSRSSALGSVGEGQTPVGNATSERNSQPQQ